MSVYDDENELWREVVEILEMVVPIPGENGEPTYDLNLVALALARGDIRLLRRRDAGCVEVLPGVPFVDGFRAYCLLTLGLHSTSTPSVAASQLKAKVLAVDGMTTPKLRTLLLIHAKAAIIDYG